MPTHRKAIICDDEIEIFTDATLSSRLPLALPPDSEIEINRSMGNAVEIILPSGSPAFIDGKTKLNFLKKAWLAVPEASVLESPSISAPVVQKYSKGDEFVLLNVVQAEGKEWVRIRYNSEFHGYLQSDVKVVTEDSMTELIGTMIGKGLAEKLIIKEIGKLGVGEPIVRQYYSQVVLAIAEHKNSPEGRKQLADKHAKQMISGVLWCVGGLIATGIGYSMVSDRGGSYLVFWGACVFGAFDFLRGLIGWINYSAPGIPTTEESNSGQKILEHQL